MMSEVEIKELFKITCIAEILVDLACSFDLSFSAATIGKEKM